MANSIAVLTFYHRGNRGAQRELKYLLHELYFFLSTRYLASSFKVSARSPKLFSSA